MTANYLVNAYPALAFQLELVWLEFLDWCGLDPASAEHRWHATRWDLALTEDLDPFWSAESLDAGSVPLTSSSIEVSFAIGVLVSHFSIPLDGSTAVPPEAIQAKFLYHLGLFHGSYLMAKGGKRP